MRTQRTRPSSALLHRGRLVTGRRYTKGRCQLAPLALRFCQAEWWRFENGHGRHFGRIDIEWRLSGATDFGRSPISGVLRVIGHLVVHALIEIVILLAQNLSADTTGLLLIA